MERVLYALLLLIGFGLRVWRLDDVPLSPWEAANSWPAWLAAQGLGVDHGAAPLSALGYGLQWLVFWIGINSEFGARLAPLLVGTALIVLPWRLRKIIGRETALVLAFLLALDPWLIQFSRLADGSILALALGLTTLVVGAAVVSSSGHATESRMRAGLVLFGLLLVSGPMGLNFVPIVALGVWLWRHELMDAGLFDRRSWKWIGVAALLGGTLGLVRVDGLAWVATSLTVWLSQFDGSHPGPSIAHVTGDYGVSWPWVRLLVDAPMIAAVGALGLLAQLRLRHTFSARETGHAPVDRVALFLMLWTAWGVLLWLLPGRSPLALPMLSLPLTLAAGPWLVHLLRNRPQELDWRELAAVVVTFLILLISVAIWAASLFHKQTFDTGQARLLLVALGLGLVIVVAFSVWARRDVAFWLMALVVVGLLLTVNLRAAWHLKQENTATMVAAAPTGRAGWQALTTHPDLRNLAQDVKSLSLLRAGDATELSVQVQIAPVVDAAGRTIPARPDPVLGWYLRDMRNLTWVTAPMLTGEGEAGPGPLVIVHDDGVAESASPMTAANYVGSVYRVESFWLPSDQLGGVESGGQDALLTWWMQAARPWVRWVVYREVSGEVSTRTVTLWASGIEGR